MVSSENTTLAGLPAYKLTYSETAPNKVAATGEAIMTEQDYYVYQLTFTSASAQYSNYQNIFATMTNPFGMTS